MLKEGPPVVMELTHSSLVDELLGIEPHLLTEITEQPEVRAKSEPQSLPAPFL